MANFGFGSITSQGVGSNINVAGIVDSMMQVERLPLDRLGAQKTSFNAKISALGLIKSKLSAFQTSLAGLKTGTSILANTATSSNSSIVKATGTSGAVAGNYTISDITSLAQSQKLVAAGQADKTAAIGGGASTTLTFSLGTTNGALFTQNASPSFDVVIDSTNNTLEGIRDAINSSNQGVTANIVNDGDPTNPYRLVLSATNSGVDQSIQLSVSAGETALFDLLNQVPGGVQNLTETVSAQDAVFKVDSIAVTKSSNTVTDVIQGVTLDLLAAPGLGTSMMVSVSQDTDSAKAAVETFVNAYNDLLDEIKKQTDSGYSGGAVGALASDSSTRDILTFIRNELTTAPTGITGPYDSLSSIGVSFQTDGKLSLDSTKLSAAIQSNSTNVADLFSSADGYATRLDTLSTSFLAYNGTIELRTGAFKDRISSLEDQQATLESRLTRTEARIRARFTTLDVLISGMNTTSNYLTQQLNILNAQTSGR